MYADAGCMVCRKKERDTQRLQAAQQYIALKSGDLEVKEIMGIREYSGKRLLFVRCQCSCGNFVEVPLNKIKSHQVLTCGHNRQALLEAGKITIESLRIGGTLVSTIDGQRKMNKNNTTGHVGVSYISRYQKYRAYISFRRKQYHLGLYECQEDAINARKEAEKRIFGTFLDWYATEYPEQWAKLQKRKKN